jgi:hypothetical protein
MSIPMIVLPSMDNQTDQEIGRGRHSSVPTQLSF